MSNTCVKIVVVNTFKIMKTMNENYFEVEPKEIRQKLDEGYKVKEVKDITGSGVVNCVNLLFVLEKE